MERRFITIILVLAFIITILSFNVKSCATKKSNQVLLEVDSKKKTSLLGFSEEYEIKGNYIKAKAALKEYLNEYPDSENTQDIKTQVENLNIKILFSPVKTEDSIMYKIKSGDALVKIALTNNTTVELIKRSNGLNSDLIIPGKTLKVNNPFLDKMLGINKSPINTNASIIRRIVNLLA